MRTLSTLILIGALSFSTLLFEQKANGWEHSIEVGGVGGVHLHSPSNELGRPDLDPRDVAPQHSAALGLRLGYGFHPLVMLEGEVLLKPTTTMDGQTTLMGLSYRGSLLVHILKGRIRPFVALGAGATSLVYSSDQSIVVTDTDEQFHAGVGVKADLTPRFGLRLDGRVLVTPRVEDEGVTPEGEILLAAYYRWGSKILHKTKKDTDGDGIENEKDLCPTEAEDLDKYEDQDGCPDPDNDQDGVLDAKDKCPKDAGPQENKGCPDKDQDNDGVVDRIDACPDKAGEAPTGCPAAKPEAPKQPEPQIQQPPAKDPDQDGDGIPDKSDRCIDKPETKNGFQDDDGCPDALPKKLAKFVGVIKGINFKTGKDEILKKSFKVLDNAGKTLAGFPGVRVEISGHTDNVGDRQENLDLSKRRAEAVKAYLAKKGVAEARMTAVGYGPDKPIADNKKKAGQAKNRRVEFRPISE